MKTINKIFFILAILLGMFYSQKGIAIDCNTPDPGCECGPWRTSDDFGQYIVIPTGEPTCYYIADVQIRDCDCGTYTSHQIRINGIEKVGDCGNVPDRQVLTETYSFLLLLAKDLFGESLNDFYVSILSPGCYRWSGDVLESCDPNLCCKIDYELYLDTLLHRWEVRSVYTYLANCSGLVGQGCRSMCDSVGVPVGLLPYPGWPISCQQTDPCPGTPWEFDPSKCKVVGKVARDVACPPPNTLDTSCNFIAFFEWKTCNGDTLFRLKYIQKGPCCLQIPASAYIRKAIKRILNATTDDRFNYSRLGYRRIRYLLSYSCWRWNILGGNYMIPIIAPCIDSLECCLVSYDFSGLGDYFNRNRTLLTTTLINSGNPACTTQSACEYMCDTLAVSTYFPPGSLLPTRWQKAIPIDEGRVTESPMGWDIQVVPNPSNRQVEFKLIGKPEGDLVIRIYNYLGVKINELSLNTGKEATKVVSDLPSGLYTYVVLLNSERAMSGTFIVTR